MNDYIKSLIHATHLRPPTRGALRGPLASPTFVIICASVPPKQAVRQLGRCFNHCLTSQADM